MQLKPKVANWPIQRKLLLIIVSSIIASLLLAMLGISGYEIATYRTRLTAEVSALAAFVSANSAPTLAFDDAATAQEILNTLKTSPTIAAAALYTVDGRLFTSYSRSASAVIPPRPPAEQMRFAGGYLHLVRSVRTQGRFLGTLYISADPANVTDRLTHYTGIAIVVAIATAGGALLLQRLLRRLVTAPLLELAGSAERIAAGDLSVRVPVASADEMGQLAGAFNHMTSQLSHTYEVLKEREEQLRHSETTLLVALDATGLGTFDFYPGTGQLIWSDVGKRHFGLSPSAEATYDTFLAALHPGDRDGVLEKLQSALRPGGDGMYSAEYRTIGAEDGKERWLVARGQAFFDQNGVPARLVGATLDITERKRTEDALRRSEERYRTLFDSIDEGFCIVQMIFDSDQRAIDCLFLETNPSFQTQTGFVDTQGKRISDVAPGHEKHWIETCGTVALSGEPVRFENRETQPGRSFDVYAFRFGNASRRQVAILFHDITARKEAEEALYRAKENLEVRVRERTEELRMALEELRSEGEERLRAVEALRNREQLLMQQSRLAAMGEMLANISHQWRQPLNVVGLLLQDLLRSQRRGKFTPERLEQTVARARELVAHLSQTIDDFRQYLKPERAKFPFSVQEVVQKTLAMFQESLREIRVDLQSTAAEDMVVHGFRNEYAQAVINILVNARDAFRERGIKNPAITVRIFREQERSVVTIADNAGGIPEEVIGRIFEPYFTTKDPDKGTGIGLFMSKTIIEKNMNGSLTVRNTEEGAEFRIEL